MTPLTYILARQRQWAERHNKIIGRDYCSIIDDNLFEPLSQEATCEFNRADGNELCPRNGLPAKMLALRSSSALAVNVFHYWRQRDLKLIAKDLRIPSTDPVSLEFERLTPVGEDVDRRIFPRDPNVDVVIGYKGNGIREVGIESKFAEAYGSHAGIKHAYLEQDQLWEGLPHCRQLAEMTCSPNRNFGVDYAQLLKHILGLKHRNGDTRKFCLLYSWYAVPHPEIGLHFQQLSEFQATVKLDGIQFRSMTYQEVIQRLAIAVGREHHSYISYLADRYL